MHLQSCENFLRHWHLSLKGTLIASPCDKKMRIQIILRLTVMQGSFVEMGLSLWLCFRWSWTLNIQIKPVDCVAILMEFLMSLLNQVSCGISLNLCLILSLFLNYKKHIIFSSCIANFIALQEDQVFLLENSSMPYLIQYRIRIRTKRWLHWVWE